MRSTSGLAAGKLFAELCKAYRGRAVASEPWAVNAPIAKRALSHLRIEVVRAHSLHLPFRDGAFDLVLDRHEEMDPGEVHRVLAPGGTVFTQQVGRNEWDELRPFFPRMQDPWTIPDFDPLGQDLAPLRRVEDRLTTSDGLTLSESRFIIEARKPP